MKQFLIMTILVVGMGVMDPSTADADSPRRARRWSNGHHGHATPYHGFHDGYPNHYTRYKAYEYWYPKYYGGFHSRHILTYGYPSGDIGLRGFAW